MQHLNALTSLRFVAALAVFLSHIGFIRNSGSELLTNLYNTYFYEGYLGVGFFFILSGYILSYSYEKRLKSGEVSKKSFYIARIARIYPLHFITLIAALPLLYFQIKQLGIWALSVLPAHLLLAQSYIPKDEFYFALNGPSWSISVEMFFYLLFPLLILMKSRVLSVLSFVVFGGTALLLTLPPDSFLSEYGRWIAGICPLTQVGNFMLGIVLHRSGGTLQGLSKKSISLLQWTALGVLVFFFAVHNGIDPYLRYNLFYIFPFSLLILGFAGQSGWWSKVLSNKTLVLLGHASFAFYLVHQLVIKYGELVFEKVIHIPFLSGPEGAVVRVLCYFIISYSISIVLHLKFEMQAKSWIQKKFAGVIK
ncbi:MAG: acyltransferase [Fibrobacterales bacterium]